MQPDGPIGPTSSFQAVLEALGDIISYFVTLESGMFIMICGVGKPWLNAQKIRQEKETLAGFNLGSSE